MLRRRVLVAALALLAPAPASAAAAQQTLRFPVERFTDGYIPHDRVVVNAVEAAKMVCAGLKQGYCGYAKGKPRYPGGPVEWDALCQRPGESCRRAAMFLSQPWCGEGYVPRGVKCMPPQ